MKIADYISKLIQEYPGLYKDVDYEKSKLKVLCDIFFTIGNGLKMAEIDMHRNGGYVVSPKYKKDKKADEWFRVKDKLYGVDKYKKLPKDYFESTVYYVYSGDKPLDITMRKSEYEESVLFRYKKIEGEFSVIREPQLYKAENLHAFSPYPFSKDFSIACDIFYKDIFLHDDWMKELILLCKRTLEYFNDEMQYKEDSYYSTENSINKTLKQFKDKLKKDGVKGLKDLQKCWGYKVQDTCPTYFDIETRSNKIWVDYRAKQIRFLNSFLKKYK